MDQFRQLSASSRCSFFGWFDESGSRFGLAGVLGFGLLRLGGSEYGLGFGQKVGVGIARYAQVVGQCKA